MSIWNLGIAATLSLGLLATSGAQAGQEGATALRLTVQDRAEIELLSARYALALGMCAADTYAGLFSAPGGWFASGSRGRVEGREKLVEFIRSYDCNYSSAGVAPPHAPNVAVPYKLVIEPSREGATGKAYYNGGYYDDVYVKTQAGWRFRARTVITLKERAAGLGAEDFDEIRRLAETNGGPYADVYEPTAQGRRFRSANVVITPTAEGAKGTAYLLPGDGYYEDVYVKTQAGWRFRSRVYVPAGQKSGETPSTSGPPQSAQPC
jgi:hypothetical protein